MQGDKAAVDFGGLKKEINISLVPEIKKGEYVIVHAGFAIQKMSKDSATEVFKIYEESKKTRKNTRANKCSCGQD